VCADFPIKVVFISPNITFLLQPMDQRMIATSKGPLPEEDLHVTKHSDPWRAFNIIKPIYNIERCAFKCPRLK
jgi:hypothetical protein